MMFTITGIQYHLTVETMIVKEVKRRHISTGEQLDVFVEPFGKFLLQKLYTWITRVSII